MTADARAKPRRKFSQGYITAWAALGTCAFAYLTLSTVAPEIVGHVVPIAQRGGDTDQHLLAEIDTLRSSIGSLQRAVESVRQETGDGTTRAELAQRLAALEDRLATIQGTQVASNAPPVPSSPLTTSATSSASGKPELSPRIIAKAAERSQKALPPVAATSAPGNPTPAAQGPAPNPILLNAVPPEPAPEVSQITTGSVPGDTSDARPAKPAAATLPKAPVVKGPVGIELANADSVEALRLNWTVINDQNGATLSHLSPRYKLSTDANAQPLTLVAGPISTAEEAVRICAALKTRGVKCKVGGFGGERL